jgi:hypothetical protein
MVRSFLAVLFLAATFQQAGFPGSLRSHLWVGPLHFGASAAGVERVLGRTLPATNPSADILCYNDGSDDLVLWFQNDTGLYQVVVARGLTKGCSTRIPATYGKLRDWKWAGGVVSRPPDAQKLRADSTGWDPPNATDAFWHLRLHGCGGSVVFSDDAGNYSFEMGPMSC